MQTTSSSPANGLALGLKGKVGHTATLVTTEDRKGLIGQPARHQGTREAGKDHLGSLGGTRDAPGRQERTNWTACKAPGRQERTNWTASEAPGRHQRGTGKD